MVLASSPLAVSIFVIGGVLLTKWFALSPLLLLTIGLLISFLIAGTRQPGGTEQFTPVYDTGVASGLSYGVAAVQGRRPYMEDMHQIVDFEKEGTSATVSPWRSKSLLPRALPRCGSLGL